MTGFLKVVLKPPAFRERTRAVLMTAKELQGSTQRDRLGFAGERA